MLDPVKFILYLGYYYGRLYGVINFEIDLKTGQARVTKKATIYAATINLLILSLVPLLSGSRIWNVFWSHTNRLHEYVFLVLLTLRVISVLGILVSRWCRRWQIMNLLESFRLFVLEQPAVMRLWRRGVIRKCISVTLTEFIHMVVTLNGLHNSLTPDLILSVFILYALIALLNVFLSQYYFAMLNVHAHYTLFNRELRFILSRVNLVELDRRKSCALANRLDCVARLQSQLQKVLFRMCHIFGLQSFCMGFICYLSLVSGCYYSFLVFKHDLLSLDWISWNNLLLLFGIICYLADIHITYSIIYYVLDLHTDLVQLLAEYPALASDRNLRLDVAFESFQLQLIRNPLKLSVLGLYNVHRGVVISMASSMILYSLFLIQYDLQNY